MSKLLTGRPLIDIRVNDNNTLCCGRDCMYLESDPDISYCKLLDVYIDGDGNDSYPYVRDHECIEVFGR